MFTPFLSWKRLKRCLAVTFSGSTTRGDPFHVHGCSSFSRDATSPLWLIVESLMIWFLPFTRAPSLPAFGGPSEPTDRRLAPPRLSLTNVPARGGGHPMRVRVRSLEPAKPLRARCFPRD